MEKKIIECIELAHELLIDSVMPEEIKGGYSKEFCSVDVEYFTEATTILKTLITLFGNTKNEMD